MIELQHVSKTFETAGGRVDALKDVSLTIASGDIYGIIGMLNLLVIISFI